MSVALAGRSAKLGAKACFDYGEADVTDKILAEAKHIQHIIDCIGQLQGTLRPLSRVAEKGTKVAVMMPAIVRDATAELEPIYSMDPKELLVGEWAEGVDLIGVRTFFYEEVRFSPFCLSTPLLTRRRRTNSSSGICSPISSQSFWPRASSNPTVRGSSRVRHF